MLLHRVLDVSSCIDSLHNCSAARVSYLSPSSPHLLAAPLLSSLSRCLGPGLLSDLVFIETLRRISLAHDLLSRVLYKYFLTSEPFELLPQKVPVNFEIMADNITTTLPPPPSTAGAPGVASAPGTNGTTTHIQPSMPPPTLPPVVIPQNNGHVPQPMSATTPSTGGGQVRRAAPEPNKRALYVGGLDPRVTEDVLRQIFETTGHVVSVKIIPDKNVG